MEGPRRRSVVLILARELAANVATPMLVVDSEGVIVFVNEAAERLLGLQPDAGPPAQEWSSVFRPRDPDGTPLRTADLPLATALARRQAAYRPVVVTTMGGEDRLLDVSAFPLLRTEQELEGAVSIFWERTS